MANLRYNLCVKALGRKPKPGEFMQWLRQRWMEYHGLGPGVSTTKRYVDLRDFQGPRCEADQDKFDLWLRTRLV